jgi:hypothetical protein
VISGIGVMLEPAADGAPSWIEKSIEFFQGDVQLNADDRGYVQFPPEVELPNALSKAVPLRAVRRLLHRQAHQRAENECPTDLDDYLGHEAKPGH